MYLRTPAAPESHVVAPSPILRALLLQLRPEIMNSTLPFVSVVMPVRNEARFIRASIGSILAQTYPRERMEVIVADGESDDETRALVADIAAADSRVRLVENRRRIMAAGFNVGLAAARGDVILMMGGHAELCPDYLWTCVDLLRQGAADCVGGLVHAAGESAEGEAIALGITSRFGVGPCSFRSGSVQNQCVDTAAFGAYRREVFLRAGPLDESMVRNQDDEFNYRIRKLGARILLAPNIHSSYRCRRSLSQLWKQYYYYGLWKVRVLQKHPRQMHWRQFVPAVFILALLVSFILSVALAPARRILIATAGAYLFANLGNSVAIALARSKPRLIPGLSLAFGTIHFSYGIGFVCGLGKFCGEWFPTHAHPSTDAPVEPSFVSRPSDLALERRERTTRV
jgi:succinoglycan biosynthesis protein ExoA